MDRYFLTSTALEMLRSQDTGNLVTIVTRAKSDVVAYETPKQTGGPGRPRIKGKKVKLFELFDDIAKFSTAKVLMYGKWQQVKYLCMDLLWGKDSKGIYVKRRFVLSVMESGQRVILCSTSIAIDPVSIIRIYTLRFKVEVALFDLSNNATYPTNSFMPLKQNW
jgi:hypothetical protein